MTQSLGGFLFLLGGWGCDEGAGCIAGDGPEFRGVLFVCRSE